MSEERLSDEVSRLAKELTRKEREIERLKEIEAKYYKGRSQMLEELNQILKVMIEAAIYGQKNVK